jgi:hypothetical protein
MKEELGLSPPGCDRTAVVPRGGRREEACLSAILRIACRRVLLRFFEPK